MFVYELPVYCGAMKVYRVLNLMSGTVYGMEYETIEEAIASIEAGKKRGRDYIVQPVNIKQINDGLNHVFKAKLTCAEVAKSLQKQMLSDLTEPSKE